MKKAKSLLCAVTMLAAFTFINSATATDSFGFPRALDARHRSVSTGIKDTDYVHSQTALGNAAKSKAVGHPVVAGSSQGDTDTLQMVKNCPLPPKLKGDSAACKTCCETKTCCTTATAAMK